MSESLDFLCPVIEEKETKHFLYKTNLLLFSFTVIAGANRKLCFAPQLE